MTDTDIKEKLNDLRGAIAEGVLEVKFQGKEIKYRSLDEMRRIEKGLIQQLSSNNRSGFKKIVTVFEKF